MSPSTWNLVGADARTALTAYVFQVSTDPGAAAPPSAPSGNGLAEAPDPDASAATTAIPRARNGIRPVLLCMTSPFPSEEAALRRSGRPRDRYGAASNAAVE